MTVAAIQQSLRMRDVATRGANYVRRLTIRRNGAPLDLSNWPELLFNVEGERGARPVSQYMIAEYDEDRGGAPSGALKVTILADGLDLDRVGTRGTVVYTVVAQRFGIEPRDLVQCRVRVRESALR